MKKFICSNCGALLSSENIKLALTDAGSGLKDDDLAFACPSYTEGVCLGYAKSDRLLPAYWSTK